MIADPAHKRGQPRRRDNEQCQQRNQPVEQDGANRESNRDAGAPQPPDKPPPGFLELILCFQRSGVGMARRGELREERRANTEVAGEIKCEACTLVVEDLYSMLLHRPATETDHHSTEDTL